MSKVYEYFMAIKEAEKEDEQYPCDCYECVSQDAAEASKGKE